MFQKSNNPILDFFIWVCGTPTGIGSPLGGKIPAVLGFFRAFTLYVFPSCSAPQNYVLGRFGGFWVSLFDEILLELFFISANFIFIWSVI